MISKAELGRRIELRARQLHTRDCNCRRPNMDEWYDRAQALIHYELSTGRHDGTRFSRCHFRRSEFRIEMLMAIDDERARQDAKFGWADRRGNPVAGSHLPGSDLHAKVSVLGEEFGEVSHAVLEGDDANLRDELIQVMAVCMAWLESREEFGR